MMDIKIKGLAHVGIPTSDLEASRKFYESLGFRTLVYAPELEGNNFLFMECNGEIIGLPQSLDADARALAGTKGAGDIDHFALYVDDIEATCEELKCRGCQFVTDGIVYTAAWEPESCRCMMIHRPDHVKIEFVEMKRLRCGNGELHCKYEKASDALPCKVSEAFLSSHEADSGRKGLSSGEPLAILKKSVCSQQRRWVYGTQRGRGAGGADPRDQFRKRADDRGHRRTVCRGKDRAGGGAAAAVGLHGVPHGRLFPAAHTADGGAAVDARRQCGL